MDGATRRTGRCILPSTRLTDFAPRETCAFIYLLRRTLSTIEKFRAERPTLDWNRKCSQDPSGTNAFMILDGGMDHIEYFHFQLRLAMKQKERTSDYDQVLYADKVPPATLRTRTSEAVLWIIIPW